MVASTRGSFKGWMVGTGSEGKNQRHCNNQTVAYFTFSRAFSGMMFHSLADKLTLTPLKSLWKSMIPAITILETHL